MTHLLDEIHLSKRAVRGLGISLVVLGLSIPIAAVVYHAASWQSDTVEPESTGPFRPELVILPAGTFQMGSPDDEPGRFDNETLHEVTLSKRFALSRTEITQGQYFAVTGERPVEERTDIAGARCADVGVGDDLPVVCIDWLDAIRFCNELSIKEGLEPVYTSEGSGISWNLEASGYRLPTEAEWEFAARAGTRYRYAGTDNENEVCRYANVADAVAKAKNADWTTLRCEDDHEALAPVASKLPNRWQLYDMTGNVWEWVWDIWNPYPTIVETGPTGVSTADSQIYRGGSWWGSPRSIRLAYRARGEPGSRLLFLGFRVARSVPPGP